uniref:Uncharacterized protein n=1 Tax=Methanosarcina thermophila TaxID=2210 RepID=Q9UXR1_METTE|nr:hypothetical protein [Methanosarcina thermophila TM-1]
MSMLLIISHIFSLYLSYPDFPCFLLLDRKVLQHQVS